MNRSSCFKETPQIKTLSEQYTKEMRFLRNFSECTLELYRNAFYRWQKYAHGIPTEGKLSDYVIGMREAGFGTTSCNMYIKAINAF